MSANLDPSGMNSRLCTGRVWHKRRAPRAHAFDYRVLYLLLDLDEVDVLTERVALLSSQAFNVFGFRARDHGSLLREPCENAAHLKQQVQAVIAEHFDGVLVSQVELLCMPRVLGFVFNPISIYYCFDLQGCLTHVIYEVNNTFGERFSYAFAVKEKDGIIQQHGCEKQLHVSPFFEVSGHYKFRLRCEEMALEIAIDYLSDDRRNNDDSVPAKGKGKPSFHAAMSLKKSHITTHALTTEFVRLPFNTLGVVVAIHWQAFRLWLKRIPFFKKPRPPTGCHGVSIKTIKG
jgi:DUF1365 family protein